MSGGTSPGDVRVQVQALNEYSEYSPLPDDEQYRMDPVGMAAAAGPSLADSHIPSQGKSLGNHSTYPLPAIAMACPPSAAAHPSASASAAEILHLPSAYAAEVPYLPIPSAYDDPAVDLRGEACHHLLEEADERGIEYGRLEVDACIVRGSRQ